MKTAYSYIRFSSSRQADGDSIRRQTELARNYAQEHQLDLQDLSVTDFGVSAFRGSNATEGALGMFLSLVDDGKISPDCYLLVESFDRLSRQAVEDALALFLQIVNRGITLVTLLDGHVYRRGELDMTKLIVSIVVMSRANEESEMKSQRTTAAWVRARFDAVNGIKAKNARLPDWLHWNETKTELLVDEGSQGIIRRIFELSASGLGIELIAKELNEEGIKTFKQNKVWRSSGVSKILRNRAVIGEHQFYQKNSDGVRVAVGAPIPEYYPVVIPKRQFLAVQQGMDDRNKRGSGNRAGQFTNLFTGLIRCGECGAAVSTNSQTVKIPSGYLRCKTSGCDSKANMNYKYTEPQVLTALSCLQTVIEKYRQPITDTTAEIELEIRQLEEQVSTYGSLLDKGFTAAIAERLNDSAVKLELAKEQLASEQQRVEVQEVKNHITLGLEPLESVNERRAFNVKLRTAIGKIEMVENPNVGGATLVYFVNGSPVLEQHFGKLRGAHGSWSEIYELDEYGATLLGKTSSKSPNALIAEVIENTPFSAVDSSFVV